MVSFSFSSSLVPSLGSPYSSFPPSLIFPPTLPTPLFPPLSFSFPPSLPPTLPPSQGIIGDCSFIASLAVCSDYERKFKTRLVTRFVYLLYIVGDLIVNPRRACAAKVIVSFRPSVCLSVTTFSTTRDKAGSVHTGLIFKMVIYVKVLRLKLWRENKVTSQCANEHGLITSTRFYPFQARWRQ